MTDIEKLQALNRELVSALKTLIAVSVPNVHEPDLYYATCEKAQAAIARSEALSNG